MYKWAASIWVLAVMAVCVFAAAKNISNTTDVGMAPVVGIVIMSGEEARVEIRPSKPKKSVLTVITGPESRGEKK